MAISARWKHHRRLAAAALIVIIGVSAGFGHVGADAANDEDAEEFEEPRPSLASNEGVDELVTNFLQSSWFRVTVTPAFLVDGDLSLSRYLKMKNIKIVNLFQPVQRIGDVSVYENGRGRLMTVKLGTWKNLEVEADFVTRSGRFKGMLRAHVPACLLTLAIQINNESSSQESKIDLRLVQVEVIGRTRLTALTGLGLFSEPVKLTANALLILLNRHILGLVEPHIRGAIGKLLNEAQTLALI